MEEALTITLGLVHLEPLIGFEILANLVAGGHTTRVCEVIGTRVLEIVPGTDPWESENAPPYVPRSRWLGTAECTPILSDLDKVREALTTFHWDELAGFWEVFDFGAVLDGPVSTDSVKGGKRRFSIVDLDRASKQWRGSKGAIGVATKIHALAKKHRLVVHRVR